ncbi:MAG TPA: TraB/GumN family protein, partial [Sphingomicrobium sp.]|nr:TraB/GumN family protein [Sphingomicrobium sp.]
HALDGKHAWFNDEVKTAFDQAGELVLEIPPVEDKSAIQPLVMKYALDTSGKPLSEKLSPAAREKFAKALGQLGAPPTAFDKFKPFFATLTLVMANAQKLGFTGEKGAEAILTKAAKDGKKPIGALETIDYQFGLFANMPEAEQVKMLEQMLDELDKMAPLFAQMNEHWTTGDAEGFAKLMNEMNAQSPTQYKILISDRNANWAEWLDQRLDKPGTVFIGVGAGHLGGKDSVQDQLAKRGIKATRVAAE